MANQLSSVEHIVVLMLENRSFDHMLGFLYSAQRERLPVGPAVRGTHGKGIQPGTNGARGDRSTESSRPTATPTSCRAPIRAKATRRPTPSSSTAPLRPSPPVATNNGFVTDFSYTLGWEANEGWSILSRYSGQRHHGDVSARACCPSFPDWHGLRRLRLTGSLPCPPRRCPTARSSARARRRATWTTRPTVHRPQHLRPALGPQRELEHLRLRRGSR